MEQTGTPSGNWARLWEVFHAVVERDAATRAQFLAEVCGDDAAFRRELEELLAAHDAASCLDRPGSPTLAAARSSSTPHGPAAPLLQAGELLAGRFEVVRLLGQGGMGVTYEARDRELGTAIALKTLGADAATRPDSIERFRLEIALGRRVTHPNVCRVFDLFHHASDEQAGGGTLVFLTMELLAGETLAERLRREGPLPLSDALAIAEQVAHALDAAHRAGVVHRDLKPSNVMLVPEAEGTRAVVTDFGLATSRVGSDTGERLTRSGQTLGTPEYMAPEQLEGREATAASDLYAFGMLLYEITTGRLPFEADTPLAAAVQRLTHQLPSPRVHRPELSGGWERAILTCLERNPRDRCATTEDALRALRGQQRFVWRIRRLPHIRALMTASTAIASR